MQHLRIVTLLFHLIRLELENWLDEVSKEMCFSGFILLGFG